MRRGRLSALIRMMAVFGKALDFPGCVLYSVYKIQYTYLILIRQEESAALFRLFQKFSRRFSDWRSRDRLLV
jgi:hypothetical protein